MIDEQRILENILSCLQAILKEQEVQSAQLMSINSGLFRIENDMEKLISKDWSF